MSTSSTNTASLRLRDRNDADAAAVLAVVLQAAGAGDLGVQGVVLAEADIQARVEAAALLAHENRAAGDDVAVVALDAQPLRIAVAAVAGTALTFFMSHVSILGFGLRTSGFGNRYR